MKIGTKTLLFGTHQIFIHPVFVLIAWIFLYKKLPKLYECLAIITHDWGYWGMPNIDGKEGELHPKVMYDFWINILRRKNGLVMTWRANVAEEVIGHSRFYAGKYCGGELSNLFYADKLAISIYPNWFYLLLGNLSGEIREYMSRVKNGKYNHIHKKKEMSQIHWWLVTKSKMCLMGLGEVGTNSEEIKDRIKAE